MSVKKRGKYYWIRFQWNGQEIRRSARTASRVEALAYERKLKDEYGRIHRGGSPRRSYNETMTRFIEEYLPQLKFTSATRYLVSARALHPHFNNLYLDQINKGKLAEFVAYRKRSGVGNTGIRRDLACLSSMLSAALRWDWIDVNPVKGMDKRDLREGPGRLRYLTHEEFEKLCQNSPAHLLPLIQFAVETGMRFSEQLGLTWDQVDLKRQEVRLTDTKSGTPRSIPLTVKSVQILKSLPRHFREPWVFWYGEGRRYSVLRRSFQTALKNSGIKDFKWHDLRHTFATWARWNGIEIYKLRDLLGHSDIKMTLKYAHLGPKELRRVVNKMGTKPGTGHRD